MIFLLSSSCLLAIYSTQATMILLGGKRVSHHSRGNLIGKGDEVGCADVPQVSVVGGHIFIFFCPVCILQRNVVKDL